MIQISDQNHHQKSSKNSLTSNFSTQNSKNSRGIFGVISNLFEKEYQVPDVSKPLQSSSSQYPLSEKQSFYRVNFIQSEPFGECQSPDIRKNGELKNFFETLNKKHNKNVQFKNESTLKLKKVKLEENEFLDTIFNKNECQNPHNKQLMPKKKILKKSKDYQKGVTVQQIKEEQQQISKIMEDIKQQRKEHDLELKKLREKKMNACTQCDREMPIRKTVTSPKDMICEDCFPNCNICNKKLNDLKMQHCVECKPAIPKKKKFTRKCKQCSNDFTPTEGFGQQICLPCKNKPASSVSSSDESNATEISVNSSNIYLSNKVSSSLSDVVAPLNGNNNFNGMNGKQYQTNNNEENGSKFRAKSYSTTSVGVNSSRGMRVSQLKRETSLKSCKLIQSDYILEEGLFVEDEGPHFLHISKGEYELSIQGFTCQECEKKQMKEIGGYILTQYFHSFGKHQYDFPTSVNNIIPNISENPEDFCISNNKISQMPKSNSQNLNHVEQQHLEQEFKKQLNHDNENQHQQKSADNTIFDDSTYTNGKNSQNNHNNNHNSNHNHHQNGQQKNSEKERQNLQIQSKQIKLLIPQGNVIRRMKSKN